MSKSLKAWTIFLLMVLITLCFLNCADEDNGESSDDDKDVGLPAIFYEHPYLSDWSSWYSEFDHKKPKPLRSLGALGIGNGRVFSLVAAWTPYNRLHNLIGPDYQKDERFFSDKIFGVYANNTQIDWSIERGYRVRKSAINITYAEQSGLEFWTIDFAPKSNDERVENTLFRIIVLRNTGKLVARGLSIFADSTLGYVNEGGFLIESVKDKFLIGRFANENVNIQKNMTSLYVGDLLPQQEYLTLYVFAFGKSLDEALNNWLFAVSQNFHQILDDTYSWWLADSLNGAQVITSSERFDDLIEGLRTTIRVQQTYLGAVSQMSEYSLTWTRDIIGPALFLTLLGRFDEYKKMIDYYWYGVLISGNIRNAMPLDLDITSVPPQPDWDSLPELSGRTAAETPSYIVWQYKLYYLATGDFQPIEERYGMLKHCIIHQAFREGGLLPFSGDETFRNIMMVAFGHPLNSVYEDMFYSANSSFLFVPAAEFMRDVAIKLGKTEDAELFDELAKMVRTKAEKYYWMEDGKFYSPAVWIDSLIPLDKPYEDVATQPLWTGYLSPDNPQAKENLLTLMNMLGYPDGTVQSPPAPEYQFLVDLLNIKEGVATGMTYGYYLDNLARVDHPMAEISFLSFDKIFNDTGNTDEVIIHDDFSRFAYFFEPFGFVCDLTARYRTWEGGIDGTALLRYLFGLEQYAPDNKIKIAPHLPRGWDKASFLNGRVGDTRFDLIVKQENDERVVKVEKVTKNLNVDAVVSVEGLISEVKVNGEKVEPEIESEWGRYRVKLNNLSVSPQSELDIRVKFKREGD